MMQRIGTNALKILVTIACLGLVLRQVPLATVLAELGEANLALLLVAALLIIVGIFIRAVRWWVLLQGVGATVSFGRITFLYFVGTFFNGVLPSGFGGDVVRVVEVSADIDAAVAAGSVLVDRVAGLLSLFILGMAVLLVGGGQLSAELSWQIGAVCFVGILVSLFALRGSKWVPSLFNFCRGLPIVGRPAGKLGDALNALPTSALLWAIFISFIFNFSLITMWWVIGRALDFDTSFMTLTAIVSIMSIALLVPSIGGLGVREAIAPLLFAGAGLSSVEAVSFSLAVFLVKRLTELIGAPLYVVSNFRESADN